MTTIRTGAPFMPQFADAKVGNRVWCLFRGWGHIRSVTPGHSYPILVDFDACTVSARFSLDGKFYHHDLFPSLFWDEVRFIAPPRPKRRVEKTLDVWVNLYANRCSSHYETREKANNGAGMGRIDCIHIVRTYEAEEE